MKGEAPVGNPKLATHPGGKVDGSSTLPLAMLGLCTSPSREASKVE